MPGWMTVDMLSIAGALVGAAAIYFIVLNLLGKLIGNGFRGSFGRVVFLTLALGLLLMVIAVTAYEVVAFYFRHAPPSFAGFERQGNDHVSYVYWTRIAFFALYSAILLITVTIGSFIGRHRAVRGLLLGLLAGLGVFVFMIITFPFVEFANACMVGRSFLLSSSC